jgi:hypothetical protein
MTLPAPECNSQAQYNILYNRDIIPCYFYVVIVRYIHIYIYRHRNHRVHIYVHRAGVCRNADARTAATNIPINRGPVNSGVHAAADTAAAGQLQQPFKKKITLYA